MTSIKANFKTHALATNGSAGAFLGFTFPVGTTSFSIKASDGSTDYEVSHVVAGTDSFLKDGSIEWFEDHLILSNNTIFFRNSAVGAGALDIHTWS